MHNKRTHTTIQQHHQKRRRSGGDILDYGLEAELRARELYERTTHGQKRQKEAVARRWMRRWIRDKGVLKIALALHGLLILIAGWVLGRGSFIEVILALMYDGIGFIPGGFFYSGFLF